MITLHSHHESWKEKSIRFHTRTAILVPLGDWPPYTVLEKGRDHEGNP